MSYPPTEAGAVSNDSIFSDSVEFDAAEKPGGGDDQNADNTSAKAALEADKDRALPEEPTEPSRPLPKGLEELPPALPPQSALMKPRKHGTKPVKRWVPVNVPIPDSDTEDEFDTKTAMKPLYTADQQDETNVDMDEEESPFLNSEPDMLGDVTNCFDEPGLLYRVVDKKNKVWAFYNDSLSFEVHVTCTFGKHSKLEALENTKMERSPNGEYVAQVVVYPCETELFVKGFVNGFTSKLKATPLSDEYLDSRSAAQTDQKIKAEMDAIRAIVGEDETDPEVVLKACLDHNIPFVDLSFPPVQKSIDHGAAKPFKHLPWARPSQYVKPDLVDQIRLFRDGIVPGDVFQGELGDCWLLCALATSAENPQVIMNMFRHPRGPAEGKRERALGAYRVTFNKNGIWRSVLVDDYLPVVANTPKFARSTDLCELWPSILEKAFAKLHQSYAMVQSGDPVHALTDMSGCPSMRFDEAFAEAAAAGGGSKAAADLFARWVQWKERNFQIVVTTPGKAPAVAAGHRGRPDTSDDPETAAALEGTGLLPGHAYSVLGAFALKDKAGADLALVKLRNAWSFGQEWTGAWARGGQEWAENPSVASQVGYDENEQNAMYLTFTDALKYFSGGGVHFYVPNVHDYRVPVVFSDCRPSCVLQITVDKPTDVVLTCSNIDFRGLRVEQGSADADLNSADYPPIMLSLAAPKEEGKPEGDYKVVRNTAADTAAPSDTKWTFLQAREIGMVTCLEPANSPYLVIPRLMEGDDTVGAGGAAGEDYESLVNPTHFLNSYDKSFPGEDTSSKKQVPVTVGLRVVNPLSAAAPPQVTVRRLKGSNEVFENFPKFSTGADLSDLPEEAYYQHKAPNKGFADECMGNQLE